MEHLKIKSQTGDHLNRKKIEVNLVDHCVFCLIKLRKQVKGQGVEEDNCHNDRSEIASKSTLTSPGFLATFNDIWSLFQSCWRDKQMGIGGISLETVIKEGSTEKYNMSLETLTMCQLCCHKVVAVENLMKAVRQQVREISMLVKESRKVGGTRLCEFEKTLRDNILDADVIKASLDFVDILGSSRVSSVDNAKNTLNAALEAEDSMECHDGNHGGENDLGSKWDGAKIKHKTTEGGDEDDTNSSKSASLIDDNDDSDYNVSENDDEDDEDDDVVITSDEEQEITVEKDKMNPDERIDPLADPEPLRKSMETKKGKAVVLLVQEGSSSKTLVCDMEGESFQEESKSTGRKGTLLIDREQVCDLCGEIIQLSYIFKHLCSHVGADFIVKCPNDKCRRMFTNAIGIKIHFNTHKLCREIAKEKKFDLCCDKCGFRTDKRVKLRRHLKIHEIGVGEGSSAEKKWKCPIPGCGKDFAVKQSVYMHLEVHRRIKRPSKQTCNNCMKVVRRQDMEEHLRDEHKVKEVISCKQCGCKFSDRHGLMEHLFYHRTEGILCDICTSSGDDDKQVRYRKYVEFREHYFNEHKLCPKNYKCDHENCKALFWRKFDIVSHKVKVHGASAERMFSCDLCLDEGQGVERFKTEHSLISHKIRVHGADPLKCEICGETFKTMYKMTCHMNQHKGIVASVFKCKVDGCEVVFKEKRTLEKHVDIVHNGMEKERHVCDLCGKSYARQLILKRHYDRVHAGERLWVCEVCGENFCSSNTLEIHKLIHTGERPFVCEICGQRFRQKVVLRTHLKGHEEKGMDFKPNGPMKGIRKRKANE